MATPEQMRKTVEAYVDALARKDRDTWVSLFSLDAVQIDPVPSEPNVGHEGIGAFWDRSIAIADRVVFDVHHLHICGDEAALVFTGNVEIGDGGMAFDAVDVIAFDDDGRIANLKAYWDPAQMRMR